jgi:MarR family transcriptional regulator for hemolysin
MMQSVFEHYILGEQAYTQMVTPVCEKHGMTYAEMTVLLFLANNPALDTASDIAKCRNLAKSHVSLSVRSLEERGLITKEYRGSDRRSVHLCLTEKASSIVKDGREAQATFIEMLFDGVSYEERKVMNEILKRIDRNVEAYVKGAEKHHAG